MPITFETPRLTLARPWAATSSALEVAAVERRSFDAIGSEAYCQICHRTGVENGVSRCGGCGVVAYCTEKHAVSPPPPPEISRPYAHKRIALPAAGGRDPA